MIKDNSPRWVCMISTTPSTSTETAPQLVGKHVREARRQAVALLTQRTAGQASANLATPNLEPARCQRKAATLANITQCCPLPSLVFVCPPLRFASFALLCLLPLAFLRFPRFSLLSIALPCWPLFLLESLKTTPQNMANFGVCGNRVLPDLLLVILLRILWFCLIVRC